MSCCVSLVPANRFQKRGLSVKLLGHTMDGICNWWFVDSQLANRNGDYTTGLRPKQSTQKLNVSQTCSCKNVEVLSGSIYLNLDIQPCWRLLGPPEVGQLSCQVWRGKHLEVRRSLIVRTLAPNPLPFQGQINWSTKHHIPNLCR